MKARSFRVARLSLAVALAGLLAAGCHKSEASGSGGAGPRADAASVAAPFTVREDSQGLLFTWIDEKGDFHVEQKVGDVPIVGRDAVRTVDPKREETSNGELVFVADLRVANLDGTYPVHTMTREDFDALAVTRREKEGKATLASAAARDAGAAPGAEMFADNAPAGRPAVIVYGASWCSACHQAMAYMKKKGITFIEKDIEQDPAAAAEMNAKLKRAGQRGGSIPVLDVRGRIMVGFEPHAFEEALGSPI
jgi:glutaredoxin